MYTMSSKWLDCAMSMSAFHYQCVVYQHLHPPSFGNHDNAKLHNLTRERERRQEMTLEEAMLKYHHTCPPSSSRNTNHHHTDQQDNSSHSSANTKSTTHHRRFMLHSPGKFIFASKRTLDTEHVEHYATYQKKVLKNKISQVVTDEMGRKTFVRKGSSIPIPDCYFDEEEKETNDNSNQQQQQQQQQQQALQDKGNNSNNGKGNINDKNANEELNNGNNSTPRRSSKTRMLHQMKGSSLLVSALHKAPIPSLFLQEMAHLLSLLSAVAMSTLRNPLEGTESPLVRYVPNKPWPPVDSDMDHDSMRTNYQTFYEDVLQHTFVFMGQRRQLWTALYFLLGLSRSPSQRALYNAARPFTVLGGVSDDEIDQLQMARGPSAKVALCLMWVQEFMTREYIAGSAGRVAAPIISDLYSYLADGLDGYVHVICLCMRIWNVFY